MRGDIRLRLIQQENGNRTKQPLFFMRLNGAMIPHLSAFYLSNTFYASTPSSIKHNVAKRKVKHKLAIGHLCFTAQQHLVPRKRFAGKVHSNQVAVELAHPRGV